MKKLVGYGIIALFMVGAVFCIEFGLRFIGLGDPLLYYENTSYRYAARPSQHLQRFGGARVTIDAAGLRSTTDWTRPADAKVLFLGDSVTWGTSSIDDRDLFSELVCVRLTEGLRGRAFTCGNAGTNAYGVENMTARLLHDAAIADADVIVVTLVSGAAQGLQTLRAMPFFAKPPAQPFPAIVELLAYAVDVLRHTLRFGGAPPGPFPSHEEEMTLARLDALFAVLREKQAAGKRVVLVHSPNRDETMNGYGPLQRTVVDAMRGSGFEFVEMRPHLQGEDPDRIYHDIVHLTPPGHRIYADVLGERIAAILESSPGSLAARR